MKTNKLLLLGIIGLFLVSCGDDDVQKIPPATNIAQWNRIVFNGTNNYNEIQLIYQTVRIDGNEYIACVDFRGFVSLCPKLPPKVEK